MDFYAFYRGLEFEAYRYLGAHIENDSVVFRTFAPAASKIALIGECTGWEEAPMQKTYDGNFWECRVPNAQAGQMYKYRIYDAKGNAVDHADPYAFSAELRPGTASKIHDLHQYAFDDAEYLKKRRTAQRTPAGGFSADHLPMNIYELQAGAWQVPDPVHPEIKYNYRELADLLVPYLKEMHYNFLELMPITEYPSDESWGYQTTGFFAATARYGSPDDLKYLIDLCHRSGIGVILDFVAVHFAANGDALMRYDGTPLYEYPNDDVGYSEWGTCNFMHSRGEVCSFLQSSVYFWLKEYHFDGIRIDAVSNLIYWQGDEGRGTNRSAIRFLQNLNAGIKERIPEAILIAEDSSSYPGVTKPVFDGGLGFDYKWDLGWMNDTLDYMRTPAPQRKNMYHKLTFSIYYYYNEKYLLPLSHDEVVHGKATIVQKMASADLPGKYAQARLLFAYMFAHPGKKLNFMGNEIGSLWEWTEKKDLDWWMLRDREQNRQYHAFIQELQQLYAENPAFWEKDYENDGFEWTDCQNEGKYAVYSFVRRSNRQSILAVFNFDDQDFVGYTLTLPEREIPHGSDGSGAKAAAEEIFDSEQALWGGMSEKPADETIEISDGHTLTLDLPKFTARFYIIHRCGA